MWPLLFLLQNEAKKSKRRRCTQDDSLSTQSECSVLFIMPLCRELCKRWRLNTGSLRSCSVCFYYWHWEHACIHYTGIMNIWARWADVIQLLMLHCKVNMSRVISFICFLSLSGMYQDVQGQLSNEKALAYPRASCARLCRVWQSLRREFKT